VTWLVDKLDQVLTLNGPMVRSAVGDSDKLVELGPAEWARLADTATAPGGGRARPHTHAAQVAGSAGWSGRRVNIGGAPDPVVRAGGAGIYVTLRRKASTTSGSTSAR
jgi:hypothetical protein